MWIPMIMLMRKERTSSTIPYINTGRTILKSTVCVLDLNQTDQFRLSDSHNLSAFFLLDKQFYRAEQFELYFGWNCLWIIEIGETIKTRYVFRECIISSVNFRVLWVNRSCRNCSFALRHQVLIFRLLKNYKMRQFLIILALFCANAIAAKYREYFIIKKPISN